MSERDGSPQAEGPKPLPGAVAFFGMGLTAAVCVGIGVGLGLWLDSALGTGPIFLLVGLALGVATAAVSVVRQIRTYL
ncbi:MAG TPA: AtpZ/AtpI family protein [Acidimicrobiales bacterium]|nr:AtpZ/AtpI family protein [Acidimicrobiales bacterium]